MGVVRFTFTARMGPAGLKNWAAKNLWEVLVKSG